MVALCYGECGGVSGVGGEVVSGNVVGIWVRRC